MAKLVVDEYVRGHVVKVCREECIESGLYGEALDLCISECIRRVKGGNDADR